MKKARREESLTPGLFPTQSFPRTRSIFDRVIRSIDRLGESQHPYEVIVARLPPFARYGRQPAFAHGGLEAQPPLAELRRQVRPSCSSPLLPNLEHGPLCPG